MAIQTGTYFNNGIVGVPQVGADVDIYETSASPKFAVGTHFTRSDGAVFVYSHFGAATNAGLLVSQDLSESSKVEQDNIVVAPASAQAVPNETINAGDKGSHYLEITLASVTADQYRGGTLIITDDAGEGYSYRIRGNTATDDPASGNFRMELYKPLQNNLTAVSDISIAGSLYANLEGATAATDPAVAGVNTSRKDTTNDYGWIMKSGIIGVLQDGSCAAGSVAALSDGVTGAFHAMGGGNASVVGDLIAEPIVGYVFDPGDDTGHGVLKINL